MNEQEGKPRERERTANNRTTTGFRISDDLWAILQPLLPIRVNTHRFGGGRPRVADRDCANAIFYVLRTGCQWQALDQTELCAHSTAHDRFQEWVEAEVFRKLWQAGVKTFDELAGIDWDWLAMDGAMTKAPLGGEKAVAAEVTSGRPRLAEPRPACFQVRQVGVAMEPEAAHLGLAFLVGPQRLPFPQPIRRRYPSKLAVQHRLREISGSHRVDRESPDPHDKGVGPAVAGCPALARFHPPIKLLLSVIGPR